MNPRGIAVTLSLLLLLSPVVAHGVVAVPEPAQTDSYTTGRTVDNIAVEASENGVSLLVSDDNPKGTTLTINRDWLRSHTDKPVEFVRFFDDGDLIESYTLTKTHVVISIPHFSTQNITATTVDAQFEVTGSASGQETKRVINYDVNETGIAILEIHGQGTREGEQRVDQFFSQVDNATFTWSAGEIPRNVSLEIIGQGSKIGPAYNKSHSSVSNGSTVFFDLEAKDYWTNVTIAGAGQQNGSVVNKGRFNGSGDGDTQTLTFDFEQNNESIVFIGNTTSTMTTIEDSDDWQTAHDWDNATSERGVVHEATSNTDHTNASVVKKGYSARDDFVPGGTLYYKFLMHEVSGSTLHDFSGSNRDATYQGPTLGETGILGTTGTSFDGSNDYVSLPSDVPSPSAYTVIAIAQPNPDGTRSRIFDARGNWVGGIQLKDTNALRFWHRDGSGTNQEVSASSYDTSKPHIYISTWDGSRLEAYIDDTTLGSIAATGTSSQRYSDTIGAFNDGSQQHYNGDLLGFWYYDGYAFTSSDVEQFVDVLKGNSTLTTRYRTFDAAFSSDDLNLTNVSTTLNDQQARVFVESDTDGDGAVDEMSDPIVLDGSGGPHEVTGLPTASDKFRLRVELNTTNDSLIPLVSRIDLAGSNSTTTTTKTQDPAIDIDGDGIAEASLSDQLNDSETVVIDITDDLTSGTYTPWVNTTNSSVVDWTYEGNNEARSYVKNITLNGIEYPVEQFLADGESTTIQVDDAETLHGGNSLTVHLSNDSETQYVDRADVTGRYENRSVVDNYTVNGQKTEVDWVLADGESKTVGVSNAIYGANDIRMQLKGNSTQINYDTKVVWYPENRTTFSNVTVEGRTFEGSDDYSGVPYKVTFLGGDDVLTFNVTNSIVAGDNTHVFRQLSPRTTTDRLDFTEKVEFHKNVTVAIEEKWGTYNKSTTESFNHTVSGGASFNFSTPERVMTIGSTSVTIDGSSATNTTTWDGETVVVQVDEEIPENSEVHVRTKLWKYNVDNADATRRAENPLSDPYLVDVGITSVTGDVTYETVEAALDSTYEVVLTVGGEPDRELEDVFVDGNATVPQSEFETADGMVIQRPEYSQVTYTGTTNTIHPTEQITNRSVTHDPLLYTEPDEQFVAMHNYSVSGIDAPVDVTWKQVGPYHLQWITDTTDPEYNQTLANVTGDGVQVLADGEPYHTYERKSTGDLVIPVNSSTTWDVYQYDVPEIRDESTVSAPPGTTTTVSVEVYNPNAFTIHNTRLVLEHGWIENVSPVYQDIGPKETATYEVTISVPAGTEQTDYTIPMNVTSSETGEVDVEDLSISVGGGAVITGTGIPNIILFGAGILFLLALVLVQLARTGQLQEFTREVEEL